MGNTPQTVPNVEATYSPRKRATGKRIMAKRSVMKGVVHEKFVCCRKTRCGEEARRLLLALTLPPHRSPMA